MVGPLRGCPHGSERPRDQGDADPGDIDEAITPVTFGFDRSDYFAGTDTGARVYAESGSLLSESTSEGPTFYHSSEKRVKQIGTYNSRLETQWKCDKLRNCLAPTGSSGNNMYMQSTLAWYAMHSGSGGPALNILFADGSVRTFTDLNEDLYLNPGFPVPSTLTEAQYEKTGYRDDTLELHPSKFFSGVFISPTLIKSTLE